MSFYLDLEDASDPEFDRVLEHGWSGIWSAARIWDLLGSEKGERLQRMLDEELAIPEGQSMSYVSQSQIARLIDLLDGIETEAEGKLIDDAWSVLPEHVERVEREAPASVSAAPDRAAPTSPSAVPLPKRCRPAVSSRRPDASAATSPSGEMARGLCHGLSYLSRPSSSLRPARRYR
jgi:hypothetical protein